MNLLETFRNIWAIEDLRKRVLFTFLMLAIYRLGAHIPTPGIDPASMNEFFKATAGSLFGFLDIFSGGALRRLSVFALGIMPYISASIILQLLTVVWPYLEKLSKEGEMGRRKINQYTRYGTVVLSIVQSLGVAFWLKSQVSPGGAPLVPPYVQDMLWGLGFPIMTVLTLTTGTAFIMWLGEQISERGIGNGISLIIFSGIIGRAPRSVVSVVGGHTGAGGIADYLPFVVLVVLGLLAIAFVIEVQQAVRKIPIQSAQRVSGGGRTVQGRQSSLPLRVNQAGVIPIIFALSIMTFPGIVAGYLQATPADTPWHKAAAWIQGNFVPSGPNITAVVVYNLLYFLFIFGFTYFYTAITFDVNDVADNLRRYSSFIPGIRPGRPTAEYLAAVMNRVTFAGAIFLGLITVVLPLAAARVTNIPQNQMYLGGTALLIVVGVALDTMKQLETQLMMRQYRGFIR